MPYSSAAVANWFLDRAAEDGISLSPMKLQKLIYFAHGWSLAVLNRPLIEEHPEAWNYGPVIPSVYHEFKSFGRNPITTHATDFEINGKTAEGLLNAKLITPRIPENDELTNQFLEKIWEVYGKLSAVQLSNMTHVQNGAWHRAFYEMSDGRQGFDIPDGLIKDEFVAKSKAHGEAA